MSEHCNCGHDHEHEECGCGCGGEGADEGIITLVDEEGVEHEFEVVDVMEFEDSHYMALVAVADTAEDVLDDPGELIVLKVVAEGVEEFLEAIEDEAEFNRVSAVFMERLEDDFDFVEDDDAE